MEQSIGQLTKGLETWGLSLDSCQTEQFLKYYELLISWNEKMNLTAITDFQEVLVKHFLDSLSLCQVITLTGHETLADIGTGAGFPGIPLKILYPELSVTLIDSLNKRVTFLNEVITQLGLEKIKAVHGRSEDLAKREEYRESFDLCVSRAVANLSTLSEYCLPFVKVGGSFVSYKGSQGTEELEQAQNAIRLLGGSDAKTAAFTLPDTDYQRLLIHITKKEKTPKKYPRKAGTPAKEPL